MLPEYDFSRAVRGRHAEAYAKGTNVVRLDDDVAAAFRTAAHVNEALRRSLGEVTVSTKLFRVIERPSIKRSADGSYMVLRTKKLLNRTDTPKSGIDLFRRLNQNDVVDVKRHRKV